MESIFVSIPSYRDTELIPTLIDLFDKSSGEYSIQPYILLQEPKEELDMKVNELRNKFSTLINIIPVDIKESLGACWARHWLQQFITHQEYYLQLDSHHRFVKDWDKLMVEQLNMCPSKSLLTAYTPPYIPPNEFPPNHIPTKLMPIKFDDDGIIHMEGSSPILAVDKPVEGNLIAGGFIFAPISFCWEVPYDPQLYFKGEEITLSVRAWTHGWNIYHPSKILLYHFYTRQDCKKHWDDHSKWHDLHITSINRTKTLLDMEHIHPHVILGMYDIGNVRTLEQYQTISGIHFKHKVIQPQQ